MHKVVNYLKKRWHLLILGLILAVGLFFRTYQVVERFGFDHDGDLYSWVVKDIVVNHHPRLIGQLTSAPGIYIGPAFYYLLAPFFLFTRMDPIGVLIPITFLGLFTILSYYFILAKLFKEEAGLIGAFLYAILITTVNADRWIVPTVATPLWAIWYFYSLVMLSRGNFSALLLLGILVGLIWHIHIALIPTLTAIPFAILLSKKLPKSRQVFNFIALFFIISLPLMIFEFKNGFQQTSNLLQNFITPREGASGWYKFQIVIEVITKNINSLLFAPQTFKATSNFLFPLVILTSALWLVKKKLIKTKELIPLYIWVLTVVLFFSVSSTPISEYYFTNIEAVFLGIIALYLYYLYKNLPYGKILVAALLVVIALKNAFSIITQDTYHKGYIEKKAVVDYITNDAKNKNFPCFSINYITSPGENVGFRYFFFLKNAHIAVAGRGSPVYNIVIPNEYALKEVRAKYGHIGIIPPTEIASKEVMQTACSGQNTNLTDPMLGFVE
ncbi:glycosyltransferase family 39 protein [Candidatus Daviesbacteria bacterium]|nr:glycosyltransferase family 39 protein [Candidatus Daviesbacteria bacterium]